MYFAGSLQISIVDKYWGLILPRVQPRRARVHRRWDLYRRGPKLVISTLPEQSEALGLGELACPTR
jgi:hypothetical protein